MSGLGWGRAEVELRSALLSARDLWEENLDLKITMKSLQRTVGRQLTEALNWPIKIYVYVVQSSIEVSRPEHCFLCHEDSIERVGIIIIVWKPSLRVVYA